MKIVKASTLDAAQLSDLTFRSKAHWGYSVEQMEKWRDDLKVSASYIEKAQVYIIKQGNLIVGYYSYSSVSATTIKLDNLFIDPAHMGKRLGLYLMNDLLEQARQSNVTKITLDADPHAEAYYLKFGFETVGHLKSSIPNRSLPVMELDLIS